MPLRRKGSKYTKSTHIHTSYTGNLSLNCVIDFSIYMLPVAELYEPIAELRIAPHKAMFDFVETDVLSKFNFTSQRTTSSRNRIPRTYIKILFPIENRLNFHIEYICREGWGGKFKSSRKY